MKRNLIVSVLLTANKAEGWGCLLVSPAVRLVLDFPVGKQNVKLRHLQKNILKNEMMFSVCGEAKTAANCHILKAWVCFSGGVEGGKEGETLDALTRMGNA